MTNNSEYNQTQVLQSIPLVTSLQSEKTTLYYPASDSNHQTNCIELASPTSSGVLTSWASLLVKGLVKLHVDNIYSPALYSPLIISSKN